MHQHDAQARLRRPVGAMLSPPTGLKCTLSYIDKIRHFSISHNIKIENMAQAKRWSPSTCLETLEENVYLRDIM